MLYNQPEGIDLLVYRRGNPTADNLTPRPGKDTARHGGHPPGLSVYEAIELLADQKALEIELNLLAPPLQAIADDPESKDQSGHRSIAPVGHDGQIDLESMEEWASWRGTGQVHPYAQILLDAIVKVIKGTK